jgi:glycosyltransferase involved in cell wall biosynthesis
MKSEFTAERVSKLKVAIVTDWMFGLGGADRLIQSIIKALPNSILYTSIYLPEKYKGTWAEPTVEVRESFLGKIPFKGFFYKYLSFLLPYAFEFLDLSEFDLVISVSAGQSKGVITGVNQPHYGIINTPPRFIWDKELNVKGMTLAHLYKIAAIFIRLWLKAWDSASIKRLDGVASISKFIQQRVKKIYGIDSDLLYPNVLDFWFEPVVNCAKDYPDLPEKYFVYIGRLYDHKRIDEAVIACIKANVNLVIAGEGANRKAIENLAKGHNNIQVYRAPSDSQAKYLFSKAHAFIFPSIEDFGILPLESQAVGCPVIARGVGGSLETVAHQKSGLWYDNLDELVKILQDFETYKFSKGEIKANAKGFTEANTHKMLYENLSKFLTEFYNDRKS